MKKGPKLTKEERRLKRIFKRTPLIGDGKSVRTVSGGLPSLGKRR